DKATSPKDKEKDKDQFIARLKLDGMVPLEKRKLLDDLVSAMNQERGHYQTNLERTNTVTRDEKTILDFTVRVDIARQASKLFTTRFEPPPALPATKKTPPTKGPQKKKGGGK